MARLYYLAALAFLLFGFSSCLCGEKKKNGSGGVDAPGEEIGNVVARITVHKLEGEPGPNQDAFYNMSIEFTTTRAIGEIIFRNSKSKFGGSRLEIKPPKSLITLIIRPATPENAGVICVVATTGDGRGFGGRFVTDKPVSEFTYDLPAGGAEFIAKIGEEVIIASGRRKVDGVQKEYFEVALKTWSVYHLLQDYANADNLVREGILSRIVTIGDTKAVAKLFQLIGKEPDAHLRTLILEAAGLLAKVGVTEPAIEYYKTEKSNEPRGKVMHLLGMYRSKRGFEMLVKTVNSDTDTKVRVHATLALGQYDPGESYDTLFKILKDDTKPYIVRQNAGGALAAHHDADLKKLLEDVKQYHSEVKPGSKMDKTLINFEEYLNKVLRGEIERHHHEEEMDD